MPRISNHSEQVTRALGGSSDRVLSKEVLVTTSTSELFALDSPGIYRIWIKNTGATALNSCKIQGRNSASAAWVDVVSSADEFQNPAGNSRGGFLILTDDAVNPVTLDAGAEWNGSIDATTVLEVRMVATVASGTTAVKSEVT